VTLDDWPHGPIRCTDGQAAVFKALWSFKGVKVDAERVMLKAGQDSQKPNDLFKVKKENKGKPGVRGAAACVPNACEINPASWGVLDAVCSRSKLKHD
jgi:hypothetical protein